MKNIFLIWLVFSLAGCAVGLMKTAAFISHNDQDKTAREIYSIAKECWAVDQTVLKAGTIIESQITLDGIIVEARWAAALEYAKQPPFVQFLIIGKGESSEVEIHEKQYPYLFKDKYKADAYRWASGNYTCST